MPSAYDQAFPDPEDTYEQEDVIEAAHDDKKQRSMLHMALLAAAVIGGAYLVFHYRCQILGAAKSVISTAHRGIDSAADSIHDMGARALGDAQQTIGVLDL